MAPPKATPAYMQPRYEVRHERNVRIPMPDGITLAADFYYPDAPGTFPVVYDYYPYRKSDSDWRTFNAHHYFAARGIVAARIDVRGSGDSEGQAEDEYSPQEQKDAVVAIDWMSRRPWCNGKVGMFGSSYGGFNSLQVAMHRPPALKAIVPAFFTDRRYTDDCHYKGGAMQMLYDIGTYGLSMVGRNLCPPRPEFVGQGWVEIWEQHLKNEPWLLRWVANQVENEQWKQGSLCFDYGSIQCAAYLVGGWRDGYTNCNLRVFQNLRGPKKVIIGPWLHTGPNTGIPGPAINIFREMARFYHHWLADVDTGIMDEPPIIVYVQEHDRPRTNRSRTTGTWRYETEWPLERGRAPVLHLAPAALVPEAPRRAGSDQIENVPSVGSSFGIFSAGGPTTLAGDQRIEEAFSAVYTSRPLGRRLEILGYPRAILHVESTTEVPFFVVRLTDVAPNGESALITKGVLNATRRDSIEKPTPVTPGKVYELDVMLDATSWVFEPGHRVRISISHADFPNTWPMPALATSTIHHGADRPSRLILPTVPADKRKLPTPDLEPTHFDPAANRGNYRVTRDHARGLIEVEIGTGGSVVSRRIDEMLTIESSSLATATVNVDDPSRASMRGQQMARYVWPNRTIQMNSRGQIESGKSEFVVTLQVDLTWDGMPYFSRRWERRFPRHLL